MAHDQRQHDSRRENQPEVNPSELERVYWEDALHLLTKFGAHICVSMDESMARLNEGSNALVLTVQGHSTLRNECNGVFLN